MQWFGGSRNYSHNAYIAMAKDTDLDYTFTVYFPQGAPPFAQADIQGLYFNTIGEAVDIDFQRLSLSDTHGGYALYTIHTALQAKEVGLFHEDALCVALHDRVITYHIGPWVFDVGGSEAEGAAMVDMWESPAASSDGAVFPYAYKLAEGVTLASIQIGEGDIHEKPSQSGRLDIDTDQALSYIRAKVTAEKEGVRRVAYAKGCFCGAMNITEEIFQQMRQHPGRVSYK